MTGRNRKSWKLHSEMPACLDSSPNINPAVTNDRSSIDTFTNLSMDYYPVKTKQGNFKMCDNSFNSSISSSLFVALIFYPWLTNAYEQYKTKNCKKYAYGDTERSLTLVGNSRDCMRKKSRKKRVKNRQRIHFYGTAEEISDRNGPPHRHLPQTSQANPMCAVS